MPYSGLIRLAFGWMVLLAASQSHAHGPVPRIDEHRPAEARLFTSDSATGEVIAIDLPSGKVVTRLATPPDVLTLGLTHDNHFLFAFRSRNTRRDTVTVIDTGIGESAGTFRFPAIVRSWLGTSPGGVHEGHLPTVMGHDAVFNEGSGDMEIYDSENFASTGAISLRRFKLAAPDHYQYLEAGEKLYVGHLAKGMVQVLDGATGEELARIGACPVLHGMIDDPATGRLLFACMGDIMVVGTRGAEADREVARIAYPSRRRIGTFVRGKDGVLWGSDEGTNPAMLRLDSRARPYTIEAIPVNAVIQREATADGSYLLLYSRDGTLDIRDGATGSLLHTVSVSAPFDSEYHEHVDKALLPGIAISGNIAYITIPPQGMIVEVDIVGGKVLRKISVGGQPTRLVLVKPV